MADKRPLVINTDGTISEMKAGDTVPVAVLPNVRGGGNIPSLATTIAISIAMG